MIESNIMNISVYPIDIQQDSENDDSQNKFNTNLNNKENSKEINFINFNPQKSNSFTKEKEINNLQNLNDNISGEIPENNIKFVTEILFH